MAYVSQEFKREVAPVIKKILAKYGMKGSLSVDNHSTLVLTLKSGKLDIIGNYMETVATRPDAAMFGKEKPGYMSVNTYWVQDHYTGKVKAFLEECVAALKSPKYFDHSDIQTDYFHCSHYIDIQVGKWNKPYELTTKVSAPKTVKKTTMRVLAPNQRIRVILNGISFRTTIKELDNCMDHTNQRQVVDMALAVIRNEPEITGFSSRYNGFDVQVDLV